MKDLITASLILFLLLGGWMIFLYYADLQGQNLIDSIKEDILPNIETGQWDSVQVQMKSLNERWHKFRGAALYFFHTETINTIDYSLARAMKYAAAEDNSNAAGELNSMIEQLSFLTANEKLTMRNLF